MGDHSEIRGLSPLKNSFSKLRYVEIAEQLKAQIPNGRYPVGSCLPSEKELAVQFGVAQMTVRQALSLLRAKGIIRSQHGKKSIVASAQEQLSIGVLFGPSLMEESASFYRGALSCFREQLAGKGWKCYGYDALQKRSAPRYPQRESTLRQIDQELNNHTFDGLIEFATDAEDVWAQRSCPLPSVMFSQQASADVLLDEHRFGYEAIDYFKQKNRTRIAYLRTHFPVVGDTQLASQDLDGVFDAAREGGLPSPTIIDIVVAETITRKSVELYECAKRVFTDWKKMPKNTRPNALIVSDDVAMRAVSMALNACDINIPDDLMIMCVTNDMADFHYLTPVIRYEYPVMKLTQTLLDVLEAKLRGETSAHRFHLISGRVQDAII